MSLSRHKAKRLDSEAVETKMKPKDGETSVPTDRELILWGWTTTQIAQLRSLPLTSQEDVLNEYIKRMMEGNEPNSLDF